MLFIQDLIISTKEPYFKEAIEFQILSHAVVCVWIKYPILKHLSRVAEF